MRNHLRSVHRCGRPNRDELVTPLPRGVQRSCDSCELGSRFLLSHVFALSNAAVAEPDPNPLHVRNDTGSAFAFGTSEGEAGIVDLA